MRTTQPDIPDCFVSGLLFSHDLRTVLLLYKARGPTEIAGWLLPPGGKMRVGESPRGAIEREFLEETGQLVESVRWQEYYHFRYRNNFRGHMLVARDDANEPCLWRAFNRDTTEPLYPSPTDHVMRQAADTAYQTARYTGDGVPRAGRYQCAPDTSPMPHPELAYFIPLALRRLTLPIDYQNLEV